MAVNWQGCDLLILVVKHFPARRMKWRSDSVLGILIILGILHKLRLREVLLDQTLMGEAI